LATYKHIAKLIVKHRKNTLSEQEKEELETWRNLSIDNQLLFNRLNDKEYVSEKLEELYSVNINEEWGKIRHMFPRRNRQPIIKYAAIVAGLLFIGTVIFMMTRKSDGTKIAGVAPNQDNNAAADKYRVQLKLANGHIVYLDSSVTGHIALQYKSVIYKQGDALKYEWSTGDAQPNMEYNTVTTPRTRTFAVELPDGSKAWLNASSSITYPTAFMGTKRNVQITGEVYFEVNPLPVFFGEQKKVPFIVSVNPPAGRKGSGARIEVMGTHFNVNAYAEEPAIKTTLFEGKVKIVNHESEAGSRKPEAGKEQAALEPLEESAILTPGQQADINDAGKLDVIKYANVQEVLAWHKDKFIFNDADIKQIMQQVARQYDYEIVYKEPVEGHFTFELPRQSEIDKVLETMERMGGIHFKIREKRIIVSR
jgi:ferric-dicitrate binding protein FerR (iron transport regulator)